MVTEVLVYGRLPKDVDHGVPNADAKVDALTPAWYLGCASNTHVACDRSVFHQYESLDRKK